MTPIALQRQRDRMSQTQDQTSTGLPCPSFLKILHSQSSTPSNATNSGACKVSDSVETGTTNHVARRAARRRQDGQLLVVDDPTEPKVGDQQIRVLLRPAEEEVLASQHPRASGLAPLA